MTTTILTTRTSDQLWEEARSLDGKIISNDRDTRERSLLLADTLIELKARTKHGEFEKAVIDHGIGMSQQNRSRLMRIAASNNSRACFAETGYRDALALLTPPKASNDARASFAETLTRASFDETLTRAPFDETRTCETSAETRTRALFDETRTRALFAAAPEEDGSLQLPEAPQTDMVSEESKTTSPKESISLTQDLPLTLEKVKDMLLKLSLTIPSEHLDALEGSCITVQVQNQRLELVSSDAQSAPASDDDRILRVHELERALTSAKERQGITDRQVEDLRLKLELAQNASATALAAKDVEIEESIAEGQALLNKGYAEMDRLDATIASLKDQLKKCVATANTEINKGNESIQFQKEKILKLEADLAKGTRARELMNYLYTRGVIDADGKLLIDPDANL